MIEQCTLSDDNMIQTYIGNNYSSCLYLYLNLYKYGYESEEVDIFYQHLEGRITCVLMNYHGCLHLYSKDNSVILNELIDFIGALSLSMIYCAKSLADILYQPLLQEGIKCTKTDGWVAQVKAIDHPPRGIAINATMCDLTKVAEMICLDAELRKNYRFEDLSKQLISRNKDGYSRNLVIKSGDLLVAHACTNAEINNIAVVAELVVRYDYRRKGFASEIWRDLCQQLLLEGKEVYSFYYSFESRELHKKIGFEEINEWSKIVF